MKRIPRRIILSWVSLPREMKQWVINLSVAWLFMWICLAYYSLAYSADYTGTATGVELDHVHGVTSAIQTQLNGKASLTTFTNYTTSANAAIAGKQAAGTYLTPSSTLANLASSTSANLYTLLSDETGSGSGALAVFNISPAFLTSISLTRTSNPATFDTTANGSYCAYNGTTYSNTAWQSSYFNSNRYRGTADASKAAVVAGDSLFTLAGSGYDGGALRESAKIAFVADGTISSGVVPSIITFITTNLAGTEAERVRISTEGKVGIGIPGYTPTARLHLPASTATANTASLKIDPGVVATTPVSGNIETDGSHFYWTNSGNVRIQLDGLPDTPNITVGTVSAGAAGFIVDADGDTTVKSITITQGTSGAIGTMFEGSGGGTNFRAVSVPDALTADVNLQHANALPAANQFQLYPAPTTGVSQYTWTTYGEFGALNLVTTGSMSAGIPSVADADAHAVTGAEAYGYMGWATGTGTWTLPAAVAGMNLCIYSTIAAAIVINPDDSDVIYLNGTALSAGDSITSASGAGDFICLIARDGTNWHTLGRSGTWTDTN